MHNKPWQSVENGLKTWTKLNQYIEDRNININTTEKSGYFTMEKQGMYAVTVQVGMSCVTV